MAVIGYAESLTNIYAIEMMAKWVARFRDGAFRLPSVRRMERSVAEWGAYMRRSGGERFRRSCLGAVNIWYDDELCRDMGCEPRRKIEGPPRGVVPRRRLRRYPVTLFPTGTGMAASIDLYAHDPPDSSRRRGLLTG